MGQNLGQIGLQPTRVHRQSPFGQQDQVIHLIAQRVPALHRPRRTDLVMFTATAAVQAIDARTGSRVGTSQVDTVTQRHMTPSYPHSHSDAHFSMEIFK
jgi:hypothetical protein